MLREFFGVDALLQQMGEEIVVDSEFKSAVFVLDEVELMALEDEGVIVETLVEAVGFCLVEDLAVDGEFGFVG